MSDLKLRSSRLPSVAHGRGRLPAWHEAEAHQPDVEALQAGQAAVHVRNSVAAAGFRRRQRQISWCWHYCLAAAGRAAQSGWPREFEQVA